MRHGKESPDHIDPNTPHVFEAVDLMAVMPPRGPLMYSPPPTPASKSVACAICKHPRTHHLHIEGEAAAQAETPKWG